MKKLLVIVDYQIDFVNGTLGFDGAEKLEPKLERRIQQAISDGEDIVFTKDIHEQDYLSTEEGKHLPIEHCLLNSKGCELFGSIKKYETKYPVFGKGAFGSLELAEYLKNKTYDEISVVGLVSYICVLSNAVICKSALPNAHIVVEKNLTDAFDKKAQETGFEALKNLHIEIR